ncbi:MAG: PEP-CTERM sorting domain-containing protein, partial [Bacteroides sp.]|nr:PEP-CTERM sorting domain-containing protein [Bacteroides sp.]
NRHSIYYEPSGVHARNFRHTVVAEYTSVPEPSIIGLFAAGLFGIGFARRRKA